jgi:hypothetical protein
MPNFAPHFTAGIVVAAAFLFLTLQQESELTLIGLGLVILPIYAVFPDIDQAGSSARKLIFGIIMLATCLAAWYGMKYLVIGLTLFMFLVMWFTEHRGLFHSMLTGVVISVPWWWYNPILAIFAMLSFSSHLLLDKFSKRNKFPY